LCIKESQDASKPMREGGRREWAFEIAAIEAEVRD
jgi:hypothetical protein